MMATVSTGVYGGPEEAPETTAVLAKGALEADAIGLSYDIPDRRSSRHLSPCRDLFISSPSHSRYQSNENYCLLISIQLQQLSDDTVAGMSIPTRALTDKII